MAQDVDPLGRRKLLSGAYPIPVTTQVPEAVTTSWIVISERVSVPVLSEQMTEAEPRVSTLVSFLTTAL